MLSYLRIGWRIRLCSSKRSFKIYQHSDKIWKDFFRRFVLDSKILREFQKSADLKEKTIAERSSQILQTISNKRTMDLRFDRNPKNFHPKDNNIVEKIISIQNYYSAREKISPSIRPNSNSVHGTPNEKIEHLENFDKLLDSDAMREDYIENKSAHLVNSQKLFKKFEKPENI